MMDEVKRVGLLLISTIPSVLFWMDMNDATPSPKSISKNKSNQKMHRLLKRGDPKQAPMAMILCPPLASARLEAKSEHKLEIKKYLECFCIPPKEFETAKRVNPTKDSSKLPR